MQREQECLGMGHFLSEEHVCADLSGPQAAQLKGRW